MKAVLKFLGWSALAVAFLAALPYIIGAIVAIGLIMAIGATY